MAEGKRQKAKDKRQKAKGKRQKEKAKGKRQKGRKTLPNCFYLQQSRLDLTGSVRF
jgi:hypothetical protein